MKLLVTHVDVKSPEISKDLDGYRAAVLADLHDCSIGKDNMLIRDALVRENPESLFIVGDMVTESFSGLHCGNALRLMKDMSKNYKIYYAIGNHELRWRNKDPENFAKYKSALEGHGIIFLENEAVVIGRGGAESTATENPAVERPAAESTATENPAVERPASERKNIDGTCEARRETGYDNCAAERKNSSGSCTTDKEGSTCDGAIRLTGLDLPKEYYRKRGSLNLTSEAMTELAGKAGQGCFNLLLAHSPQYFEAYAAWGADLTISGHFHGGIVRLPFLGGVVSPYLRFFPKYDRGIYKSKTGGHMALTSGLGTHTFPRINNPSELMILDFAHGDSLAVKTGHRVFKKA